MTSDSSAEPKWAFEKYLKDEVSKRTKFHKWMKNNPWLG
jgi:hypothetical protein